MDSEQKRYQQYVHDVTGDPVNPIERRVKAMARGIIAFWMIFAFVIVLLLLVFFDELVFGTNIL